MTEISNKSPHLILSKQNLENNIVHFKLKSISTHEIHTCRFWTFVIDTSTGWSV